MATPDRQLLILGTSSFAVEVADVAREVSGFEVAGFVENLDRARCTQALDGCRVYWIDEVAPLAPTHWVVCGLGTTRRSRFTDQAAAIGCRFVSLVHPTARVSSTSTIGAGTLIHPGALVASHSRVGSHVGVNRGATVGHHTVVEDFATIGPGVNLAGNCRVGQAAYLGIGATVIDNVAIGANAVVGAGAVVTRDVPERVLVVGVPARIVKSEIDGK